MQCCLSDSLWKGNKLQNMSNLISVQTFGYGAQLTYWNKLLQKTYRESDLCFSVMFSISLRFSI